MMVSRNNVSFKPSSPLHLGDQLLDCVSSYKYLGVHYRGVSILSMSV